MPEKNRLVKYEEDRLKSFKQYKPGTDLFSSIPLTLLYNSFISFAAKCVYAVIRAECKRTKHRETKMSQGRIAHYIGTSQSTVSKAITELEKWKWLRIERLFGTQDYYFPQENESDEIRLRRELMEGGNQTIDEINELIKTVKIREASINSRK